MSRDLLGEHEESQGNYQDSDYLVRALDIVQIAYKHPKHEIKPDGVIGIPQAIDESRVVVPQDHVARHVRNDPENEEPVDRIHFELPKLATHENPKPTGKCQDSDQREVQTIDQDVLTQSHITSNNYERHNCISPWKDQNQDTHRDYERESEAIKRALFGDHLIQSYSRDTH